MVCAKERVRTNRRVNFHALRTVFDAAHKGASEVRTVCGSAASTGLCGGVAGNGLPYRDGIFHRFWHCAGKEATIGDSVVRVSPKEPQTSPFRTSVPIQNDSPPVIWCA